LLEGYFFFSPLGFNHVLNFLFFVPFFSAIPRWRCSSDPPRWRPENLPQSPQSNFFSPLFRPFPLFLGQLGRNILLLVEVCFWMIVRPSPSLYLRSPRLERTFFFVPKGPLRSLFCFSVSQIVLLGVPLLPEAKAETRSCVSGIFYPYVNSFFPPLSVLV